MRTHTGLPLVYSCSGCSNVAQLANDLAVQLDRSALAEMSCIAGVGGDVPALVRVARSGRPTVVIDGCPLACARSALARHGVVPTVHHLLSDYGLRKMQHTDLAPADALHVYELIVKSLPSDDAARGVQRSA